MITNLWKLNEANEPIGIWGNSTAKECIFNIGCSNCKTTFELLLWIELCHLQEVYVETLAPRTSSCDDSWRWGLRGGDGREASWWVWVQSDWGSQTRRKCGHAETWGGHTLGGGHMKTVRCQGEACGTVLPSCFSEKTEHPSALISDLKSPEPWQNKCCF